MAEDSPSRARIAQAFDAAAAYDAYAVVQRQVAAWLAERIVAVAPPRPRVLEVGCGTGFLTQAAWPRLDRPEWLMTDIAPEMLARGRAQMPDLCARVMDGERPDLAGEAPFDLIVSSLAVQWFSDLEGGLPRIGRRDMRRGVTPIQRSRRSRPWRCRGLGSPRDASSSGTRRRRTSCAHYGRSGRGHRVLGTARSRRARCGGSRSALR
jgi:SAM-dependent methyltransferase